MEWDRERAVRMSLDTLLTVSLEYTCTLTISVIATTLGLPDRNTWGGTTQTVINEVPIDFVHLFLKQPATKLAQVHSP